MLVNRDSFGPALTPEGAVVAIGAFDGVHLGHAALVSALVRRARELSLPSVVVTFEPLPRQYFGRERLLRLTPFRERLERLRELGIDRVLCLRFGPELAGTSAEDFVTLVLAARLCTREVWVGPGFRFGRGREGDIQLLRRLGIVHRYSAHEIEQCSRSGDRVSSTAIRIFLGVPDFAAAQIALGRRYTYSGRVVRGKQLGRKLGFPTANLRWPQDSLGFAGIFAVRVNGAGLRCHPGVASLGYRPAVGGKELLLEVHLFDFHGDLYGRRLTIDFIAKQRDEWHFADLDALVLQIRRDADEARRLLRS